VTQDSPDGTAQASPPGVRLGLPAAGPGSVSTIGRRLLALAMDWAIAVVLVATLQLTDPEVPSTGALNRLIVWFVLVALITGLTGASIGQHLCRMRVTRVDGRPLGLWRATLRTLLIALVIPAVVQDDDRRGLHDIVVASVVLNR
jgi:uncharacterized RDD family membrane protein YckC